MRTLLLAPELFTSNGGIPRILRLYARALSELPGEASGFAFLSLGDHVVDSAELRRHTGPTLSTWAVSSGHRWRFIRRALRWSRRFDHIVCGHVHLLPVAWLMRRLNPRLTRIFPFPHVKFLVFSDVPIKKCHKSIARHDSTLQLDWRH